MEYTDSGHNGRTEFYCQWFDARRDAWVTPTDWLRSGGYSSIEEARTLGVASMREYSPTCRVRIVCRVVTVTILDEVSAPAVEPNRCTDPDCPDFWAEHDKH